MTATDIILEALIGRVEGFADGHGEVLPGPPVDCDPRSRNPDVDAHADASGPRMLAGTVHRHATLLDPVKEMFQLLGSFADVPGKVGRQELALIKDLHSNGHHASDPGRRLQPKPGRPGSFLPRLDRWRPKDRNARRRRL